MTNGASAYTIERDIVFGRGGDMDLKLDVYRPSTGPDRRTAVIHLHGGGFRGGSKDGVARSAGPLAAHGYVCIGSQYRLGTQAKWPAQIEDVKAAIRWTRANAASLGIDPARIVIAGYSAGGHLALHAAGTANLPEFEGTGGNPGAGTELAACFAYYPATRTSRNADGSPHILMPVDATDLDYERASPITFAGSQFPPSVLFHTTGDVTIPFSTSMELFQRLHDAGVRVELHILDGLSHAFDRHPEFAAACAAMCDLFLDRHVVEPREYPAFGGPQPAAAAR